MKSKEEIEALALELYPTKHGEYDSELINSSERKAFIKGYEMAQDETLKYEKICAQLIREKSLLKDAYQEIIESHIPEQKWDEIQLFLSTYKCGLANDFAKKELNTKIHRKPPTK